MTMAADVDTEMDDFFDDTECIKTFDFSGIYFIHVFFIGINNYS